MTTAVVLAGGASRRMGQDKLVLEYQGSTLLETTVARFAPYFDKIYLSVAEAGKYPHIAAEHIADIYQHAGPLAGLHAALRHAADDGVFLLAADLPFASPQVALEMIDLCGDHDACVIFERGHWEPLFGYYRKTILPYAEAALAAGKYSMLVLYDAAKIRRVSPGDLGELWDEKILLNINRPEDYRRLKL